MHTDFQNIHIPIHSTSSLLNLIIQQKRRPQSERNKALADFRSGKVSLLVATDVAARGIDVNSIGLVVQADSPRDVDTYTHRVGRTGRAGRSGEAVTFLDSKSGFGIAAGLVDLLMDANQRHSIPSWMQGMSYIARARSLDEEMKISAGSFGIQNNEESSEINEEFGHQDFRRTAAEGSYGKGKDNRYLNFEDEAYNSDLDFDGLEDSTQLTSSSELSILDAPLEESSEGEIISDTLNNESQRESTVEADSFERIQPSRQLIKAISDISEADDIGDIPEKKVLDALAKRGQKLRFEYLGLFPFHLVSPLLMSSQSNSATNDNRVKILMVAEKPSIAKAIADALSGKRDPYQRRGVSRALPVYEFTTDRFAPINGENERQKCLVRVTSVVGHVYSLAFNFDDQEKGQPKDPREYFTLPVTKVEESTTSKLRVVDHLRALAGDSDHLVLWLDCDPEGENIAHEGKFLVLAKALTCAAWLERVT